MILITGHAGFIGKHLTKALDAAGIEWGGMDLRYMDDITNIEHCRRRMIGKDIVVHLAAKTGVGGGETEPNLYLQTNVIGTDNLLKIARDMGVKHFIYFSSASVYGNGQPPLTEVDKTNPTSVYGQSKISAEFLVKHSGIPYTIVRPFNVYGENGRSDQVIYKWAEQVKNGLPITIRGDGNSKRGYTYVGDLVAGLLEVIGKQPTNEIYNFGSETPVSLNEVADFFDAPREYVAMPANEIKESWADSFKAAEKFGFSPTTDFKIKTKEIINSLL